MNNRNKHRLRLRSDFPAPHICTDTTFMANRSDLGFGNDERARQQRVKQAKAAGTDIGGKFWSPQLNTWVGSKSEVKKLCEQRGLACDGVVNVAGPEPVPDEAKGYEVAPDIVEREVERITEDHGPEMSSKELTELPDATKERLSGRQD